MNEPPLVQFPLPWILKLQLISFLIQYKNKKKKKKKYQTGR